MRMSPRRHAPVAIVAVLALASCSLLPNSPQWHADVFDNATFDDVFDVAAAQIDKDYDIAEADRQGGHIESAWDYNSTSPVERLLQRERVIAELDAVDDGIEVKLRVETQVKERTGLLAPDDQSDEDWDGSRDDVDRAAVIFQRIESVLVKLRPSEDFERRFDKTRVDTKPPLGGDK